MIHGIPQIFLPPSHVRFNHDAISCTAPRKTFRRCVMIWVDVGVRAQLKASLSCQAAANFLRRMPARNFPARKSNLLCSAHHQRLRAAGSTRRDTFCTFHLKTLAQERRRRTPICRHAIRSVIIWEFRPGRSKMKIHTILPRMCVHGMHLCRQVRLQRKQYRGEWRFDSIYVMESK